MNINFSWNFEYTKAHRIIKLFGSCLLYHWDTPTLLCQDWVIWITWSGLVELAGLLKKRQSGSTGCLKKSYWYSPPYGCCTEVLFDLICGSWQEPIKTIDTDKLYMTYIQRKHMYRTINLQYRQIVYVVYVTVILSTYIILCRQYNKLSVQIHCLRGL